MKSHSVAKLLSPRNGFNIASKASRCKDMVEVVCEIPAEAPTENRQGHTIRKGDEVDSTESHWAVIGTMPSVKLILLGMHS